MGIAALDVIEDERLAERAAATGAILLERMRKIDSPLIEEVRGRGLLIGLELTIPARIVVDALLAHGVAAKDTHGTVIRITPPLIVSAAEIDYLIAALLCALEDCTCV